MSVKVQLNADALTALTQGVIEQTTAEIAARAGEGFVGDVITTDRPHGAVRADTDAARQRNARENTLLKAVFG
ncbi:hypothetical protein [Actinomyces urogenitalis]|uniref:hypothetical protein n=1 Tax=Actinomyces urogenitalis TaxID=103621 RepID=UPI0018977E7C|nr:hypothetical protein [Actinomyces urogenitalis]